MIGFLLTVSLLSLALAGLCARATRKAETKVATFRASARPHWATDTKKPPRRTEVAFYHQ